MKALVLGATGAMGRRAAAELARSDEVQELQVAGRDHGRVERLAALLGGARGHVTGRAFDAQDVASLNEALRGHDVIVTCLGPAYAFEGKAVRAAIEAGTSYVSLCDDQAATDEVLMLDASAKDAGVTVISGCGLSPGLTNLLAALARAELDEVLEIDVAVASSSKDPAGPAATLHFLHMLQEDATYLSERARATTRSGGVPRPVYFPEPVGWVETFPFGHPEIALWARGPGGLKAARFRFGLTERPAMDLARALAWLGALRSERRRRLVARGSIALAPILSHVPPVGPDWSAARIDVHGIREGHSHTVSLGVSDHLTNLATVPLTKMALELGSGRVDSPGVHGPETAVDARSFLQSVAERGVRGARLEPYPV